MLAPNTRSYNIRREKGLIRDPKTGKVGPNRSPGLRYTELADEMVVKFGRVGQKALKVYIYDCQYIINSESTPHTSYLSFQGWYNYDKKIGKGRKPLLSSEIQELVDKYSTNSPNRGRKLEKDEIVERIMFPLVNEGFKILEERIASDPADIDIIYLYGYGFPAWKGTSGQGTFK